MFNSNIIGLMAVCVHNNAIGYQGKLPWHYPSETQFFRSTTDNNIMIMGRKTFDIMPKSIFHTRKSIIFSRKLSSVELPEEDYMIVHSINEFLNLKLTIWDNKNIFMIGGGEIAELFLRYNLIKKFILTKIYHYHLGDTFFDLNLLKNWQETKVIENKDYGIYKLVRS